MPKLLKIGAALNCGAPGRISEQIGVLAKSKGWDVYIAHGLRHANPTQLKGIAVSSEVEEYFHALQSVFFDRHGLGSKHATERLIKQIQLLQPDIIHLHNLHGYFLNFKVLFEYFATIDTPIIWTMHDCWPFTGRCTHFVGVNCNKWKIECNACKVESGYTVSRFSDNSKELYMLKKRLFTSVKNMTMVPVSDWQASFFKDSFLSQYLFRVIHNGVDVQVFEPKDGTRLREKHQLYNKFVILGVAAPWSNSKGLADFIKLRGLLDDKFGLVMVGLKREQIEKLPSGIIGISRTECQQELAEYYSMADVFCNMTYLDTFPTVNIEALACGTPVITYDTGGSPEAIDEHTGIVIPQGDLSSLVECIKNMKQNSFSSDDCRKRAVAYFNKDDRYREYLNLYNELIAK